MWLEYIRGNLSELVKLEEIKGEIVLLVEGKQKEEIEIDYSLLKNEIDKLIKNFGTNDWKWRKIRRPQEKG